MRFPFLVPAPVRLSQRVEALEKIESSHRFTNFGPVNESLEKGILSQLFAGTGACTTVCNATLGLMLAIKRVALKRKKARYVIMPSFTFAAAANAVEWCGLTPLIADIAPETWTMDLASVRELLADHPEEVALVFPYAAFGNGLDLAAYEALSQETGIPVVVDAAASMGSFNADAKHFGQGSPLVFVFSMHATKVFPIGEGGLVYSADAGLISDIRAMSNFGFDSERNAQLPGLNAKLSEHAALLGVEKLGEFAGVIEKRRALYEAYRACLQGVSFQHLVGQVPAAQCFPVLLPPSQASHRSRIVESLAAAGLEVRTYFSPCIHEHPYLSATCMADGKHLRVTQDISRRILNFPIYEQMTVSDVEEICVLAGAVLGSISNPEEKYVP